MAASELYDIVRGIWRADLNKVRQVQYVLGVYNNLIVCCFKPDHWKKVGECISAQLPIHVQAADLTGMENRVLFECDNIDTFDENQQYYLHKSIEKLTHIQKSQNPITYIGL